MKRNYFLQGKIIIFGFLFLIVFFSFVFGFSKNVFAAGGGCTDAQAQDVAGSDTLVIYNAPSGNTINKVCVKSSTNHFEFTNNGSDGCYAVSGIGTGSVTVEKTGQDGNTCQDISHIDVYYGSAVPTQSEPTPSPTTVAEENPENPILTPTPTTLITPTLTQNPTPNNTQGNTETTNSSGSESNPSPNSGSSSSTSSNSNTSPTATPTPIQGVLGVAKKILPQTGIEALWIIIAIVLITTGASTIALGIYRKRINNWKNQSDLQ